MRLGRFNFAAVIAVLAAAVFAAATLVAGHGVNVVSRYLPREHHTQAELITLQDRLFGGSVAPEPASASGNRASDGLIVTLPASVIEQYGLDDLTWVYEGVVGIPVEVVPGEYPTPT